MSEEQRNELYDIGYAMDNKQQDINQGTYKTTNEQIDEVMGSARSIIKYLRRG